MRIPINPMNTAKSTPRDVFLYLLMTAALYAVSVAAISLLFQLVNAALPDVLTNRHQLNQTLRTALSVLVIVTPVYVWVMRMLNGDLREAPERLRLGIRRWLVHLTLFVSGVTIVVDLVTLVYNFLSGELTGRFLLKVLAVLVVAVVVFLYYIWDLKRGADAITVRMQWLARAALAVLAVAVVGGFFVIDSPKTQRMYKLDQQRVEHLWTMQSAIEAYWWEQNALPEALAWVDEELLLPTDPTTGASYEYHKTSDDTYELCATFDLESEQRDAYTRPAPFSGGVAVRDFYAHRAGRDCFERSVNGLSSEIKPLR